MFIRLALPIAVLGSALLMVGAAASADDVRDRSPIQLAQAADEVAEPQEEALTPQSPEEVSADEGVAVEEEPEASGDLAPEYDPGDASKSVSDRFSDIEEIKVTGTAAPSSADLTEGNSITQFKAEDLEALGAQSIADLANFTPNLEIVTTGATSPTLFIRGVGLNDFNANSTSAVSVYQDDVHVNSPGLQLGALYDVEAVNVLRGPQGYGSARNASAGAIKIYSKKPSGEYGGFLRSDFGNYGYKQFEGAVEAPIHEDVLSARLAFIVSQRDGFMYNRCGNAPPMSARVPFPLRFADRMGKGPTDAPWSICGETVAVNQLSTIPEGLPSYVNDLGHWAARGTLLFEPTLESSFLLTAHGSRRDQLTTLGQAYGTRGYTCLNGDLANCFPPGPPAPYPFYPAGSRSQDVLGGPDALGYQAPEVKQRLAEIVACAATPPCPQANRALENFAKVTVANELAAQLDSEPFAGDFNRAGRTTNDTWAVSLRGEIELPRGLSLKSVSGYDTYDRTIDIDLDFTPNTLFQIVTNDDLWQFYQDLALHGELGSTLEGSWDVGGYLLLENLNVRAKNDFGQQTIFGVAGRQYEQDLYSGAVYANGSLEFWDGFILDGGVRWNVDRKKIDYTLERAGQFTKVNLDNTWDAPTGALRLTYRFREDTETYWKYTRGWKGGHYNATSSDVQTVSVADPEENNAFEVGTRGSYWDDRLGINAAFFYYAYNNYQIFTAQQFLNGQPEFVIINAEEAESYGFEADIVGEPWEGGYARINFGWLETQFINFVQEQQTAFPTAEQERLIVTREIQNSGHPLLNSPKFTITFSLHQRVELGRFGSITPRYDGVWKDDTYYDATEGRGIPNAQGLEFMPENTIAQKAFWLHNLRLTYRPPQENIEIAFWVRNLTNQVYKTFAFDGSTFNNTTIYFVGDPRTFGGSVRVSF